MKIHRNKMILIVFALQLLMLLAVIAMVCAVSGRGRTVTLEMAGYDPYDCLLYTSCLTARKDTSGGFLQQGRDAFR